MNLFPQLTFVYHPTLSQPSPEEPPISSNDVKSHLVISASIDTEKKTLSCVVAPNTFYGKMLWFFFGKPNSIKTAIASYNQTTENSDLIPSNFPLNVRQLQLKIVRDKNGSLPTEETRTSFSQKFSPSRFSTPVTRSKIIEAVMEKVRGPVEQFRNMDRQQTLDDLRFFITEEITNLAPSSLLERLSFLERVIPGEEAQKIYDDLLLLVAQKELADYDHKIAGKESQDANAIKDYNKNRIKEDFKTFWSDTRRLKDPVQYWAEKANLARSMKEKACNYSNNDPIVTQAWDERIKNALQAHAFSLQKEKELHNYDTDPKLKRATREKRKAFIQEKLKHYPSESYYKTAWEYRLSMESI